MQVIESNKLVNTNDEVDNELVETDVELKEIKAAPIDEYTSDWWPY